VDLAEEAARALGRGDGLLALKLVGRAEDALGTTLRGIAYAQLGDLDEARTTLERAATLTTAELPRARIRAALVEVLLAEGDAGRAARDAQDTARVLARLGDARNAALQQLVQARAEVLLGQLDSARRTVDVILEGSLMLDLRPVAQLVRAEVAMRSLSASAARKAAKEARSATRNELLSRTLDALEEALDEPIARLAVRGELTPANLGAIERARDGRAFLVDACRRVVLAGKASLPLATRPVLFSLLLALARAWPKDVPRDALAQAAFAVRIVNASHRARMRVEIGRLRKILSGIAEPVATKDGYRLATGSSRDVIVLLPLTDDDAARVAILLSDGARWSAQAIAEHAGISKRTAQRALSKLLDEGKISRTALGKEVRYAAESPGGRIASRLLLLGLASAT